MIVIGTISLFINSPLPIIILLTTKQVFEVLLNFVPRLKEEVERISKYYEDSCLCVTSI